MIPFLLVLHIKNGYCYEVWPDDSTRRAYTLGLFITQFIIPLFVITIAYTKVVLKLRHQAARFSRRNVALDILSTTRGPSSSLLTPENSDVLSVTAPSTSDKRLFVEPSQVRCALSPSTGTQKEIKHLKRNKKVVKMLMTVVTFYAICMLPNQVVWLWFEFGSGQKYPHIKELLTLGSSMVYLNSSVNPLLYAGMNEDFRKGFINLLCCRRGCRWGRNHIA